MQSSCLKRQVGVLGGLGILPPDRLSGASRRVLGYLAVKGPRAPRNLASMALWPDLAEERARANLRRSLWQLPQGWVVVDGPDLVLDADVDLTEALEFASMAIAGKPLDSVQLRMLSRDILPGWYEEWLVAEQDQFHLWRVQALEEACRTATRTGSFLMATNAGLAAVCAEPLRESAVTALVQAHISEGNLFEARRRYLAYEALLGTELGATPGAELRYLVSSFGKEGR